MTSPVGDLLSSLHAAVDRHAQDAALLEFVLYGEGRLNSPEDLETGVVADLQELLRCLEADPSLGSLTDYAGGDTWAGIAALDRGRFVDPTTEDERPFRHLLWKPPGGLWTSPGTPSGSLWADYLDRHGTPATVIEPVPVVTSHRILAIRDTADHRALLERVSADRSAWADVATSYDAVRFSWRAVVEGLARTILEPSIRLDAISVPTTLWLRWPDRAE